MLWLWQSKEPPSYYETGSNKAAFQNTETKKKNYIDLLHGRNICDQNMYIIG